MTDRPIIFSAPMVRALIEGRKTQTRRVLKPQPLTVGEVFGTMQGARPLPYAIGDRLWVREAFGIEPARRMMVRHGERTETFPEEVHYRAHDETLAGMKWRPSIHMPRKFSRLTLTVTDVRVERLQEISADDALAEGIALCQQPSEAFHDLWNTIYGPDAWDRNDWIVALTFTVEQRNIDA